ncbi:hypothetical protein IEQ34_016947 [Dendrobium chrysotoxum]|uniref:RING-type domain-containing protein n=1 Tax=Dendrobium chrysotoxum TaxID=161865 RepID=A0AAV7GH31_DENCH|nr:hypothetical protein IEQ34_016947 [Dendrobium chrysotoxum]
MPFFSGSALILSHLQHPTFYRLFNYSLLLRDPPLIPCVFYEIPIPSLLHLINHPPSSDTIMQDPYNGKVLLAAVICLSVVILFVILLHLYGRWLLHRSRTAHTNSVFTDFHLRRRSSVDETAAVAVSSRDIGMDSTAVAALPIFVYNGMEQNGKIVDCVVCLSVMEEGEKGRILPRCGHGFHVRCIDVWLMANSTCPICRAPAAAVAVDEEEDCEVMVVVVESNEGVGEVTEMTVVEMGDVEKEESSSSSSSTTTTMVGGSLKRMLSRSRSDKRVFPSVLEN